ncbi:aldehyde dehydrogenase family protein, partial [Sphingomonas sp. CCH5-D11]|uniref:aldehyde dehydrogenase family protein n=1 Tax=Sphingomonas sp. CCH5-D11 TaxID=1768786 RepID=UPI0012E3E77C
MNMDGTFPIGARLVSRDETFQGYNPTTGETIAPAFAVSTTEDVAEACRLAAEAFDTFRETSPEERARFLEAVAEQIEAIGDDLVQRAMAESGLPQARLTGERGRTTGQLRLFAQHLRRGAFAGVTMDTPLPERQPLPRSDLRQRRIAIGPVAVFGASNFPLAFSVAGGDTASALAAGCPVVVKGHPAHPGTTALVAQAIQQAVAACGLPEGVFSLVQGPANELGAALVTDPRIKAVGFTGSRGG